MEKRISSISGTVKIGQGHKRIKLEHSLIPNTLKIKDLRLDSIKLLEENIGRIVFDINHSNIFLDPSPKTKKTKTNTNKLYPTKF